MSGSASWGRDVDPDFQELVLEEVGEMIGEVRKRRGPKSQTYTLVLSGVQVDVEVRRVTK